MKLRRLAPAVVLLACFSLQTPVMLPAATLEVDDIMEQDPEFRPVPRVVGFLDGLKDVWLEALQRPDSELKRMAADTLTIAHRDGMEGLQDAADQLTEVLIESERDPVVARAAARALVALDARQAAELLAERNARSGLNFAQVVEPALGRWEHEPMLRQWRARLEEPTTVSSGKLRLAIDGLGEAGDRAARAALRQRVSEQQRALSIRLAAARALAKIQQSGLSDLAERLADSQSKPALLNRLLAVELLGRHEDPASVSLLGDLASDPEPTVAGAALERLFEIDPQLVFDFASEGAESEDVNVRRVSAAAFFEKGDVESVRRLVPLLGDHNPSLRRLVAARLLELADREALRGEVVTGAERTLAGQDWRGIEQASFVLVNLDHKPAAERFLELLEHPRREVMVTAAWALRRLQIAEMLPVMHQFAQKLVRQIGEGQPDNDHLALNLQLSQLLQAFGAAGYAEAEPLLRELVPKNSPCGPEPRAAACWSLGHLLAGEAPKDLSRQLLGRLKDRDAPLFLFPEEPEVRRQCAVSLGRMQAKFLLDDLRAEAKSQSPNDYIGHACYWAIEQLTGEAIPEPEPTREYSTDWFLQPVQGSRQQPEP